MFRFLPLLRAMQAYRLLMTRGTRLPGLTHTATGYVWSDAETGLCVVLRSNGATDASATKAVNAPAPAFPVAIECPADDEPAAPGMTLERLNRISGLLLSLLLRTDREGDDYADRMFRHALSCIRKATAALKRGDESEAHRLARWAYGSVRMALGK